MDNQRNDRRTFATAGALALEAARLITRAFAKPSDYNLRGKVALITGGSRGLGLVLARELAIEGARLVICARDAAELERARVDLATRGADVLAVTCDVTNRSEVDAMMAAVIKRFGQIDILINNAGVIQVGPMEVMEVEDYEEAMGVHFWGPLYTTLAALPSMKRLGAGRVVNISSIGGKISVPHLLPYSASKFALVGLSEGLRAELAKDGIVVTTVCPGLMRTGSPRNATFKGKNRKEYAWFSVSDSLPLSSINAERAARRIVEACKRGEAEVIITTQAKLAVKVHDLFPGLTADLLGLVNRLLPRAGGIGTERAKGKDSESWLSPSWLTALSDKAAQRNNEIA